MEKKEARKRQLEDASKRKALKKLRTSIENEGWMKQLTKEEEELLAEDRGKRLSKHIEDNEKTTAREARFAVGQAPLAQPGPAKPGACIYIYIFFE